MEEEEDDDDGEPDKPEDRGVALTPEEEAEVIQILTSHQALEIIGGHLDNLMAGEDDNKRIIFLLLLSGKANNPSMKVMILIKGTSGAGKSTLMEIADCFNVRDVGRFTRHALDWSDLAGYEVLRLKEFGHMDAEEQGVSTLKFLSARARARSTTRITTDDQYERRNWLISPDETPEQTERIRGWLTNHEMEEADVSLGFSSETSKARSKRILTVALQRIEMCDSVIPFVNTLTSVLKSSNLRVRGDYKKLLSLIKLYGIFQQNVLPCVHINGGKVVFMLPEKALEILKVAILPLTVMVTNLDPRTQKFIELFELYGITEPGQQITKNLRDQMAAQSSWSSDTARLYLNELEKQGLLSSDRDGRSKRYQMLHNLGFLKQKLSAVSEKIENSGLLLDEMREEGLNFLNRLCETQEGGEWGSHLADSQLNQLLNIQSIFSGETYHLNHPPSDDSDSSLSPTNPNNGESRVVNPNNEEIRDIREPQNEISLAERLSGLRSVMTQLKREYDAVDNGTILDAIQEAYPDTVWTGGGLEQVIEIAMRDGVIFNPRPDFYRLMGV